METLGDKLETVDTKQFSKARKLIENKDIWIHRAYEDRVIFKIQGNDDQYQLGFDPKTKESQCLCPAETYNNGDCYHKIAAQIFLSQKTQVTKTVQKEIKFTEEHMQKIKNGEKQTTLRKVKKENLYPERQAVTAKDGSSKVEIKILSRKVVVITEDEVENFDSGGTYYTTELLADMGGFESYKHLTNWFISRGYNIPQPMFLYNYRVVEE